MTTDTISDALAEAYASARANVRTYDTLELYHADWASVHRVVNDTADFTGTLEASAPRNAETAQTFTAFAFSAQFPARSESGRQDLQIQLDGVSLDLFALIRSSAGSSTPIQIIYRAFCNTDASGPGRVHTLYVKSININKKAVTLTSLYADYVNRRAPSLTYKQSDFPGLFK